MAKVTPFLNDFRAGEANPKMDARPDLEIYPKGCKTLVNVMPILEGGIARVPGTYYVRPVKTDEGWYIRITKSGNGDGLVTSDLIPGIDCGSSCYFFFIAGTTVVLTAVADEGSAFTSWSGCGFSGTNPISVYMDSNKDINAEFSLGVHDYLIAWYKNNEGSGSIVNNYATDGVLGGGLLPNLDVCGDLNMFWNTESGFGYSQFESGVESDSYAKNLFAERLMSKDRSYGIFLKRTVLYYFTHTAPFLQLYYKEFYPCLIGIMPQEDLSKYKFLVEELPDSYEDVTFDNIIDKWYFVFIDDSDYPKIVLEDGALHTFDVSPLIMIDQLIRGVCLGANHQMEEEEEVFYDGSGGAFGDAIIYNNKKVPISTPGSGYTPWATWYDNLRGRYGMAARSGW